MRLIADIGRKTLLSTIDGDPAGVSETLFRGDIHSLELALLDNGIPVDPTGKVIKLGIGLGVDTVPVEGRITFGFGLDTTDQFSFSGGIYPTHEDVELALNALPSVIAAGGVTVSNGTQGTYRIDFVDDGPQVAFSASGYFLPGGQTIVSNIRDGGVDINSVQLIQAVSGPFALASGFTFDDPVHFFAESTPDIWVLELPITTLQAQIFWDSGYVVGVGASSDAMTNALVYAGIDATATALDKRRWLIYTSATLAEPTVLLTAAPVLTADLRLDRSALTAALGVKVSIPAVMELEITEGSRRTTALQTSVTVSRTVLDDPSLPAGVDTAVYMIKSDYDGDDDGIVDLAASVKKTGGALTGDQIEAALFLKASTAALDALETIVNTKAADADLTALEGIVATKADEADLVALAATAALKANNLSDLANKGTAVQNLTQVSDNPATYYTLLSGDTGKIIRMTAATAIALAIPAGLPDGFNCIIIQQGAGQITLSGAGIQSAGNLLKTFAQYAPVSVVKVAADTYNISGNLTV